MLTTIIGVVSDVHEDGLYTEPQPEVYSPLWQRDYPMPYAEVAIRTHGRPSALTTAVRGVMSSIDKDQAVYDFLAMHDRIATSLSSPRFNMLLMGVFAALALALAGFGIYSVTAYSVAQRTHEIGLRLALGGRSVDVLVLVVREGILWISIGIGIGIAGASALTRLLRSLLFKVGPYDPVTFLAVSAGLALLAGILHRNGPHQIPSADGRSRRTASINPIATFSLRFTNSLLHELSKHHFFRACAIIRSCHEDVAGRRTV